jgi:hypothetical protein
VWQAAFVRDQKTALVREYVQMHERWRKIYCPAVDSYNLQNRGARIEWGEEQGRGPTVPFEGKGAAVWAAPDVQQRLGIEVEECSDPKMIVEDPVAEHIAFKRRVAWTPEEKEQFVMLFWEFPHQFRRIAKSFPDKCTKDMVEMYYLSKTSPEMMEGAANKVRKENKVKKKVTLAVPSRR